MRTPLVCLFFYFSAVFGIKAQWHTVWESKGPSFRSIAFSNPNEIVVSGSKGYILKSEDAGKTWQNIAPSAYSSTDFRGLQMLHSNTYIAMSSGPAEEQKAFLIRSDNGGKTWQKTFDNTEKGIFYDAIAFKNKKTGYLLGDPLKNQAYFYKTKDGGKTWKKIENIPILESNEASYAASNSNIIFHKKKLWFCTQNRIFYSKNKGKSWVVFKTPFENTNMKGIYGLGFNQTKNIMAVGGDYNAKEEAIQFALGDKIGQKWDVGAEAIRLNASESIAILDDKKMLAVGTGGTYLSINKGKDWKKISATPFHVIACKNGSCYAAGNGIIVNASTKDFENR